MAFKKGFNQYKIIGDTTIIYLERRDGEIFKTFIDTEDLERIIALDLHWYALYSEDTKSYYVRATEYFGRGLDKARILSKEIMREYKCFVDHINHDTLDNRKSNLRVVVYCNNSKNRKSRNSNNKSGYRNVSWDNSSQKWLVQLQVNGKNKVFGRFKKEQLEEAAILAECIRNEYYGEYKGLE